MISKRVRQARIVELVRRERISSQQELSSMLERHGVRATQSTLSRDIRDLGVVKVRGRYQPAGDPESGPQPVSLRQSLRRLILDHAVSGNILMLRTAAGNGHSLGVVLDSARWSEVLGTVAGDDTVFALLRSPRVGRQVRRKIEDLLA